MPKIVARAHAKLNLALALAPPEPAGSARAGWHRICTWMHAVDLADEVLVEPLGEGSVSTWSAAWAADAVRPALVDWGPERDLAWRALAAVEARVGRRLPTRIALRKRIPAGAGLGGGSADAGAALAAIDRAWGLGLGAGALREIGEGLGSDVPFFVDEGETPRPAVVGGFGGELERVGRSRAGVVLVAPPFGCATGRVYRAFDGLGPGPMREAEVRELAAAGDALAGGLFNDLARAAEAVRPELAELRARVAGALSREAHVTGSGSGVFALCREGEEAGLAAEAARALAGTGAAVRACRLA